MFGLIEKDIEFIIRQVKQYGDNIKAVGIFGSRATESFGHTSDIDIVLYGENIDYTILSSIADKLENDSPYPFYVDVVHYESIKDATFKNQIDKNVTFIFGDSSTGLSLPKHSKKE